MSAPSREPLDLNSDELSVLRELLESERAKLLVEVRHTDHRAFREELRRRLGLIEGIAARLGGGKTGASGS